MASCPNNPVFGRNLTDNFTFNETTKQIVPKPGTDTKPGALALNLGNNLPGDTTNATDALTAAGFNAMANAVDTTDPFCGNPIQQAVTAAVAQSIGCDADAQEAIACAIASNPDAMACLQAVLGGGSTTSGKYYVATARNTQAKCYKVDNGVVTDLTPSGVPGFGTTRVRLLDVNKDNPVAYYWDAITTDRATQLRQVTMSDTGVTVANFDMTTTLTAPPGVDDDFNWLFDYATYDPLTKALYIKVQAGGKNTSENSYTFRTALVKLTLNAQGLATGSSVARMLSDPSNPAVVPDSYFGGQAAQGKIPLGSGKIFDAVAGTVSPGAPALTYGIDRSMSPDGTKYVGRSEFPNQTVKVYDTATNALVCTITPPADGFLDTQSSATPAFSEDSSTVFVCWSKTVGDTSQYYSAGPLAYDATTGLQKQGKVFAWPVTTRPGEATRIYQPNAANGAMLLGTGGGLQKQGIFEFKNDAWYQVADLPAGGPTAGFYLVSP